MKQKLILIIVVILAVAGCSTLGSQTGADLSDTGRTQLLYNKFIEGESPNVAQLTLFFAAMPKGGDLHHHFSGSIYAETYLDWVQATGLRLDKNTLRVSDAAGTDCDAKSPSCCCLSVEDLRSDTELYRRLLTLWSDKDYYNHYHRQLPPDAAFFDTFSYFGSIFNSYREGYSKGLLILKQRAIKENVSYIESMISSVGYSREDRSFDSRIGKADGHEALSPLFDELSARIEADPAFLKSVDRFVRNLEYAHRGIDDDRFTMRYQTYASRNSSPSVVFSALYAAFTSAGKSNLLVGVNLVGPENGAVAIAGYTLHMQMFAHLKKRFPGVNIALHAGELTLGMVTPEDLTFHISQATRIAGAQRIGHGVDLPYEENALALLKEMKSNSVVEINLTSNEFILGVKDKEHPYLIYSAYDVPLVICTDDSGVSRNNLSSQYVLLAARYRPGYRKVKEYVYNSISYSFLPERDKKLLTRNLDLRFEKFEADMAGYSRLIQK